MTINGKEVHFRASIRAMKKIASMCPGGDINNAEKLFSGSTVDTLDNTIRFVIALTGDAFTAEELEDLDVDEFAALQEAAMSAFRKDQKGEVKVAEKKDEVTAGDESNTKA